MHMHPFAFLWEEVFLDADHHAVKVFSEQSDGLQSSRLLFAINHHQPRWRLPPHGELLILLGEICGANSVLSGGGGNPYVHSRVHGWGRPLYIYLIGGALASLCVDLVFYFLHLAWSPSSFFSFIYAYAREKRLRAGRKEKEKKKIAYFRRPTWAACLHQCTCEFFFVLAPPLCPSCLLTCFRLMCLRRRDRNIMMSRRV